MDDTEKDKLKEGLDRLDELNIDELSDSDLDAVAGGSVLDEDFNCNSSWCCSTTG